MQNKLTAGNLLDENGRLAQAGYATSLVKKYDRNAIKAGKGKIKEWDYYLVYNSRYGVALTVDDNGYMGMISASLLNFCDKCHITTSKMFAFPMGKVGLAADSGPGKLSYKGNGCEVEFENDGKARKLHLVMANFSEKQTFTADLTLFDAPKDSMVIATPFTKPGATELPKEFYYNQKVINMSVSGTVIIGDTKYWFTPPESRGLLDWGRGVWTRDNTWLWSAAQTSIDDKKFGFNLGYGFGDTSAASENMLFYDGTAHKLEGVTFEIPKDEKGGDDYMKPWKFTSTDGRFEARFTPILDRSAKMNALILSTNQHQVFGFFDGVAKLDDGTPIEIKHVLGFAEKVRNVW